MKQNPSPVSPSRTFSFGGLAFGSVLFSGMDRVKAFWSDPPSDETAILNVQEERQRLKGAVQKVRKRARLILGLVILNVVLAPVLRPTYRYIAVVSEREERSLALLSSQTAAAASQAHEKKTRPLIALFEPNQTDLSVLSWAATGITEIMTLGFGDIDQRIMAQKNRFTEDGWKSFLKALRAQKVREGFKMGQLVLTTVPTDMPVIVSKGPEVESEYDGEDMGGYQWIVEMPVIMTYSTNNNVSSAQRGVIRLTIVKVSQKKNKAGIGIKSWLFV